MRFRCASTLCKRSRRDKSSAVSCLLRGPYVCVCAALAASRGSRWASTNAARAGDWLLAWSSASRESRRKSVFASSAASAACVCSVEARSGAGDERYEKGVRGRSWTGLWDCGGLIYMARVSVGPSCIVLRGQDQGVYRWRSHGGCIYWRHGARLLHLAIAECGGHRRMRWKFHESARLTARRIIRRSLEHFL